MPESDNIPESDRKCSGRLSVFGGDIQCQLLPGHGTAVAQPDYHVHFAVVGQVLYSWPKC